MTMIRFVTWLLFVAWLLPAAAGADLPPAKGRLLVATELVGGDFFAQTVILLLHYDDTGAMGLVVNRPTEIEPGELLEDVDAIAGYHRTVYWGGPVQMDSLRALLHTDTPSEGADTIVDSVHGVLFDDALENASADPASVRFYIGHSGWAAGQLDDELARGSWHVLPASAEIVFGDDPEQLWKRLMPAREYRAALDHRLDGTHRVDANLTPSSR